MSLIVCNDWFVNNSDKTITFTDTVLHTEFKTTGVKKDGKYEHVVSYAKSKPYVSTQFTGYQLSVIKKNSYVFVFAIGRRLRLASASEAEAEKEKREKKSNFVQIEEDIEIMFGLKEGKLSTEKEEEPVEQTEQKESVQLTEQKETVQEKQE